MTTATKGQPTPSIGSLLASEREKRGIPVEKAAKETRMRPQRIRDMESDDLSQFTNPSYARMFIIAYAKYLGIPMKTICDHLPDRGEPGTEGYQYISTSTEEMPSLRYNIASKPVRQNTALYVLAVATLSLILVGSGSLTYYLVINANRLTAVVDKPPPTPEPAPTPLPAPVVVIKQDIVLTNLQPNSGKSEVLENEISMAAPPTPAPVTVAVRKPAPRLNATIAPLPVEPENEDRAFLFGSSPDQKPATSQ